MTGWAEFENACPEIAMLAKQRFEKDQLVMLGTIRKDGSARISPCEVDFASGHLFLGMMWRSPKAMDLLRDPRIVVHSVTCNRDGTDGDVKLYGRVNDVTEPVLRGAFREAVLARIQWAPDEPEFHLFSLEVEQAAHVVFGDGKETVNVWDPSRGSRSLSK